MINLLGNFGGSVGPWLMGYIKTTTNSFIAGFYALAGVLFLSSVLILFVDETKRIELSRELVPAERQNAAQGSEK